MVQSYIPMIYAQSSALETNLLYIYNVSKASGKFLNDSLGGCLSVDMEPGEKNISKL